MQLDRLVDKYRDFHLEEPELISLREMWGRAEWRHPLELLIKGLQDQATMDLLNNNSHEVMLLAKGRHQGLSRLTAYIESIVKEVDNAARDAANAKSGK